MMMAVHRRQWPALPTPRLPSTVYFRLAAWIAWTALRLLHARLIGRRGLLAALKCYHLVSGLGMRAWRAERRQLLR
jgi:hypothetical protein